MGRTSDDARWATMVAREVSAVVVGVAYRLAPEHPFPTAVEDGVCALLHLSANAETLGINASKMTLSGFSAGGNLAFTVPLRLEAHLRAQEKKIKEEEEEGEEGYKEHDPLVPALLPRIVSIIAWYPNVDARLPRAHRIATSPEPTKTLPSLLTSLFDASYFPLPSNTTSPYASPAAATDEALTAALPDHVALYLCEWDMLLREGQEFGERLKGLGKRVRCQVIKERRHGFDKSPWPFGLDWKVMACYTQACRWLCEVNECATFYTPG